MIMYGSNFYRMTPLSKSEYIQVKMSDNIDKIIKEYNLRTKTMKDESIYIIANQIIYGLPQSGLLANYLLEN